ncbi:alpha/beta hydrolase [Blastococcus haudaquaticus]|uniref:Acetyl esterase/lipase n=1 Tax=Blastococcus haudaquaticus TaxID=1938745 RepID=A0A286GRI7_9ACTN|nr:alpha/beta hydrolase [Blastococcus haudaquaticus]SOD98181.1 Acetyl esterase/lipase [Blastococcus haudaquaticus]
MPIPALPLPPPAHEQPLPAALPGPDGTRLLLGVPYAAIPGLRPLELDLHLPAESGGPVPVVVFLHGGGWRMGSRHAAGPMYRGASPTPFELVAQAGIAVASVDYRLSGEATFPAQLHDAKAAVRWLRTRAAELGIDPTRIAAWGESAGGHLAELLGLVTDPALEGDVGFAGQSSHVSTVVAWYAPSDVAAVSTDLGTDPADATTREALLLGAPARDVPELAAQASPISHVSAAAPPFLLLHGAADQLIPPVQSERLHDALTAVGVDSVLELFEGANHMWLGSPAAAQAALERTIDELRCRVGARSEQS